MVVEELVDRMLGGIEVVEVVTKKMKEAVTLVEEVRTLVEMVTEVSIVFDMMEEAGGMV